MEAEDLPLRLNALTLVNCLLSATQARWVHRQKLVYTLDQLGCNEQLLFSLGETDERFQAQVRHHPPTQLDPNLIQS